MSGEKHNVIDGKLLQMEILSVKIETERKDCGTDEYVGDLY